MSSRYVDRADGALRADISSELIFPIILNTMWNTTRLGAEEACWAHNPEVDGSKPSIAFGGFQVHNIALLAQSVERRSHNPWTFNAPTRLRVGVLSSIISNPEVDGSIPPRGISGLDIHILFEDTSSGWAVYRTPSS